jgi:hypothetical protein
MSPENDRKVPGEQHRSYLWMPATLPLQSVPYRSESLELMLRLNWYGRLLCVAATFAIPATS